MGADAAAHRRAAHAATAHTTEAKLSVAVRAASTVSIGRTSIAKTTDQDAPAGIADTDLVTALAARAVAVAQTTVQRCRAVGPGSTALHTAAATDDEIPGRACPTGRNTVIIRDGVGTDAAAHRRAAHAATAHAAKAKLSVAVRARTTVSIRGTRIAEPAGADRRCCHNAYTTHQGGAIAAFHFRIGWDTYTSHQVGARTARNGRGAFWARLRLGAGGTLLLGTFGRGAFGALPLLS